MQVEFEIGRLLRTESFNHAAWLAAVSGKEIPEYDMVLEMKLDPRPRPDLEDPSTLLQQHLPRSKHIASKSLKRVRPCLCFVLLALMTEACCKIEWLVYVKLQRRQ